ncbi:MAG: exosortase/archaeosortase family protein [candidate division Zixibacteria bacterium]|nr:exosortase/archaeosortase family protein [candidate division Zixibacteria bacterium]
MSKPINTKPPELSRNISDYLPSISFFILLILVYLPVFIPLVRDWYHDPNYSHGFLIIPVALYLIWNKRAQLISEPGQSSRLWGWLFVIGGFLLLIIGTAGAELFSIRLSFVVTVWGAILLFWGYGKGKLVLFPIAFLLFMIPIPYTIYYSMTLPMQLFATKISMIIIKAIGIPALSDGNIIILPGNYRLEVAEACSGLRSLVSLLALGAIYAHMTLKKNSNRWLLFLLTIPIAIVANIFRVSTTAIGAYGISRKIAEDFLHELSGIMVFVISTISLIILGAIISWALEKKNTGH